MPTTSPDASARLFTVAELAALWKCSKEHVYMLVRTGELPTVQLGRGDRNKLRIAARDVEAYIEANRSTAAAVTMSRRAGLMTVLATTTAVTPAPASGGTT